MARIGGVDIYSLGMMLMIIAFVVSILIATGVIKVSNFENYRQDAEGFVTAKEGAGYVMLVIAALIMVYAMFQTQLHGVEFYTAITTGSCMLGFYLLGVK